MDPAPAQRLIHAVLGYLPESVRAWAQWAFPEWFLPSNVILKKEKKPTEDIDAAGVKELFDTEVRAYRRLKPLQGSVVPVLYGQVWHRGTRALLMQDVGGVSLGEPEGALLDLDELSRLLQECYRATHAFGVHPSDIQLRNFHLVRGKLMVLDLELVEWDMSPELNTHHLVCQIYELAERYQERRAYFRRHGLLEAA